MRKVLYSSVLFVALSSVSGLALAQEKEENTPAAEVTALESVEVPAPAPAPTKPAPKYRKGDYVVAKVDGEPIRLSEVEAHWATFFQNATPPDLSSFDEKVRQSVVREVINKHLVYNDALRQGYLRNADIQRQLQELQRQLVIQTFVADKAKNIVTEDALKAAYDAKVAAAKDQDEVRARHILVASEPEALDILKLLDKGEDFEKLAKEKSDDKATAVKGGDLGYFTRERMVPEFTNAAFDLRKGEVSKPIKTDFGWHIIKLEDRRKLQVGKFEDMKEQLKLDVVNAEISKLMAGLMDRASIRYFGADGKEKPFEKKPGATSATPAASPAKP